MQRFVIDDKNSKSGVIKLKRKYNRVSPPRPAFYGVGNNGYPAK